MSTEYWVEVEKDGRIFLHKENDGWTFVNRGPERETREVSLRGLKAEYPDSYYREALKLAEARSKKFPRSSGGLASLERLWSVQFRGPQIKALFIAPKPGVTSVRVNRYELRQIRHRRQRWNIRKGHLRWAYLTCGRDERGPAAHLFGYMLVHIYIPVIT